MPMKRYELLKEEYQLNDKEMYEEKKIMGIHPSFRIISTAHLPSTRNQQNNFFQSTLELFHFHSLFNIPSNDQFLLFSSFCLFFLFYFYFI